MATTSNRLLCVFTIVLCIQYSQRATADNRPQRSCSHARYNLQAFNESGIGRQLKKEADMIYEQPKDGEG